jgi:hypothetical protein
MDGNPRRDAAGFLFSSRTRPLLVAIAAMDWRNQRHVIFCRSQVGSTFEPVIFPVIAARLKLHRRWHDASDKLALDSAGAQYLFTPA